MYDIINYVLLVKILFIELLCETNGYIAKFQNVLVNYLAAMYLVISLSQTLIKWVISIDNDHH